MKTQSKHKVETARLLPRKNLPRGTILNARGEPVRAITAPSGSSSAESRVARMNGWRDQLNPLRGLTIARAVALLEDYNMGRMADLQWTYFHVEGTDPDMIALLSLRIGRIIEMDYNLNPEDGAPKNLVSQQEDYLWEKLAGIDNIYEAIEHLAMAPFRGFAHVEKYYNADGDIYHLEPVDHWNLVRDGLRGAWKYNPKAKSTSFDGLPAEAVLPMERFLYREVRRPINRFGLLKFIKSNLSEKDWDAFNEIYNVPGGVVVGPPDVAEEDEAEYEAAAQQVAEGGSGYLPHGSTYTPNEMPHDPKTFKDRLDHLSEKLVLAGTGGMLTMLAEAGSGTLAGGAHTEVFERIAKAEARRISEIIQRNLIMPWLEEGFPGQEQVVYFALAANEEPDSAAAVEQVSKLTLAGFDLDPEQVTQKTGWKVTRKDAPATGAPGEIDPATGKPITNRATTEKLMERLNDITFEETAKADLAAAVRKDQDAILKRLAELDATTTDAEWMRVAREIDAAWPGLLTEWVKGEAKAAVLADASATALVSGAIEGAKARAERSPAKPLKNRRGVSTPVRRAKTRQR
ncbi:MAG: DUF935 family protein [Opitutaceae bacterium]|jgi:phage gp29-like protein